MESRIEEETDRRHFSSESGGTQETRMSSRLSYLSDVGRIELMGETGDIE